MFQMYQVRTTSTEENFVFEQSFQRNPVKTADGFTLPEKLGELLVSLHFLLICKILLKLKYHRSVPEEIKDYL